MGSSYSSGESVTLSAIWVRSLGASVSRFLSSPQPQLPQPSTLTRSG